MSFSADLVQEIASLRKRLERLEAGDLPHYNVGARVYNSTDFTHNSTGNWVAVTFDTERFDTDTIHSTSTNTSRLTINTGGKYLIGGAVTFTANATGQRQLGIRDGGATFRVVTTEQGLDAVQVRLSVVTLYDMAANDYVELMAWQDSGGNLDILAQTTFSPEFWCWRLA